MKKQVYFISDSVVWYAEHVWWSAPNSAFQTAGANTGWVRSDWGTAQAIAGDLVTPATPEQITVARRLGRKGGESDGRN